MTPSGSSVPYQGLPEAALVRDAVVVAFLAILRVTGRLLLKLGFDMRAGYQALLSEPIPNEMRSLIYRMAAAHRT